ncbi:MAG: hypothetical protein ACREEP_15540 [Dongiaceae bacterium]
MNRRLCPLSWLALCLLAAGCATSSTPVVVDCPTMGLKAMPRTEERQAFDAAGFSVEYPRGDHWCILRSDSAGLMLAKNPFGGRTLERAPSLDDATHTFGAMATTVILQGAPVSGVEGLRAFLDRSQQAGLPSSGVWGSYVLLDSRPPGYQPGRVTLVSATLDLVKIQGTDCVLSNRTSEERDNPNQLAAGQVLILLERSWYCLIPGAPRALWIMYSERYIKGSVPHPLLTEALQPEVEPFVQSLRVMAPPL